MSENKTTFKQKAKVFFQKNSYAIVVSGSVFILAIALAVTAIFRSKVVANQNLLNENLNENTQMNQEDPIIYNEAEASEPTESASTQPVVFTYPVKDYTFGNGYTDTTLVYNQTMNEWSTHNGIDFLVTMESDVLAVLGGVVENVYYSTLEGNVIVLNHGNGLKTIYKSLSSENIVQVGDQIESGQVIGKTSDSAGTEVGLGSHLHFETMLDGTYVDPMNYLGEK